jgi:polysaccharide export outer membrane protein
MQAAWFHVPGTDMVSAKSVQPMPPIDHPSPVAAQLEKEHLISVGDRIEIRFPYKPDFNQAQVVRDDGLIVLPLIHPVAAAGKTPEALQTELQQRYASISYNPVRNRAESSRRRYLITVGDTLNIRFESQSEYDEQVIVRPDGKISLARVRTVQAEGKTPEDLEQELIQKYKPFLKDPSLVVIVRRPVSDLVQVDGVPTRLGVRDLDHLTVTVARPQPQQVYVTGEVERPGAQTYRVPMTALRALILAGGHKRTARLDSVIILRKTDSAEPVALKVDLWPEIRGKATTDVALKPYDIVVVPKTCVAKVQDVLDQYLYNLIPATRASTLFNFFVDLNPTQPTVNAPPAGAAVR